MDGTSGTAEGSGDLLLNFDHTHITFGLVVVKIDSQIRQESEDRILIGLQTVKQIASRALFDFPTLALAWRS